MSMRERRRDVLAALEHLRSRPEIDGGRIGLSSALRLTLAIAEDLLRPAFRRGRRHVPIVGGPGSFAVITVAGAESGWQSTVPPGAHFDDRIATADAVAMVMTSATRHAPDRCAARHYDSDHFAIYHPPLVSGALADQTAFLQAHLGVSA
jgi:hypothetical protein